MFILLFRNRFAVVDHGINVWIPSIHSGALTNIALAVSFAFDTYSLLAITLGISAYLFFKNYRAESLLLLGTMGGDALLVAAFKSLVIHLDL